MIIPFSRVAEARLREAGLAVTVVRRLESFVELGVERQREAVRIHLAYDSPHRFAPPVETSLVWVNDFQDLVVDKLLAFFGRAEPRDGVDLQFILREVDAGRLIELAPARDPGFDLYWLARALEKVQSFPDEATRGPVEMVQAFSPLELKASLHRLAVEIMDRLDPRGR